jgi:hypothetical protein
MATLQKLILPKDTAVEEQKKKVEAQLRALQGKPTTSPVNGTTATMQAIQAMGTARREGGQVGMGQLQQIESAVTQKLGTQAVEAEQTQREKQGQISSLQLQQASLKDSQRIHEQETLLNRDVNNQQTRFSVLNRDLAKKLHDDTMEFQHDELGRTIWNEKQLMDYAVIQAKNQEELENYATMRQQMVERKQQVMKQAYAVIGQTLQQMLSEDLTNTQHAYNQEHQEKRQQLQLWLTARKKEAQDKMDQANRQAAETGALWGIVTAAGAAVAVANPAVGAGIMGAAAIGKYASGEYASGEYASGEYASTK